MIPEKITRLAGCIKEYEGYIPPCGEYPEGSASWRNNNPGNARYSPAGYLPKYGRVRKDPRGFAIFPTYEQGWLYLQNMLLNWAKGKKANYTILRLMQEYAPFADDNDPEAYSRWIVKRMKIPATTKLKDLLV